MVAAIRLKIDLPAAALAVTAHGLIVVEAINPS